MCRLFHMRLILESVYPFDKESDEVAMMNDELARRNVAEDASTNTKKKETFVGLYQFHLEVSKIRSTIDNRPNTDSSFRNIHFCRMQQTQYDWLSGSLYVNGVRTSPNSLLYRKPLNLSASFNHTVSQSYRIPDLIKDFQHSKPPKNTLSGQKYTKAQNSPFNGSHRNHESLVSFLSWNSILSSSETLIHTSSLIK